jgi:hypothetical protein
MKSTLVHQERERERDWFVVETQVSPLRDTARGYKSTLLQTGTIATPTYLLYQQA